MKKSLPILLPFLGIVLFFSSCKKEDPDITKPYIGYLTINGISGDVSASAGSTLSFVIGVNDDKELKQVKIDIHDAFDNHHHSPNVPWTSQTIYNVSGKTSTLSPTLTIPANASSGPYDVILNCIDASGNEALFVLRKITITQNGQPVMNITAPDLGIELDYAPGDTLHISGTIDEDNDLTEIHITLENETTSLLVYDEEFALPGTSDVQWDFSQLATLSKWIILPTGTGHYHLKIKAVDNDANNTVIEQHVHVD